MSQNVDNVQTYDVIYPAVAGVVTEDAATVRAQSLEAVRVVRPVNMLYDAVFAKQMNAHKARETHPQTAAAPEACASL